MSRLLFAAIPAPGHFNPMLAVAEELHGRGHEIVFHSGESFRKRVEAAGLRFVPFAPEADFDYRDPSRAEPSINDVPSSERGLTFFARMLGGRIPVMDRALRRIIEQEKIDAILYEVLYLGAFPLLLRDEPRPAVIGCGVVAPMWLDPGASLTSGFSSAPGWRERNLAENQKIADRRGTAWRYIDAMLKEAGVAIPGGFHDDQIYRLPDVFLQFGTEAIEFPREESHGNVAFVGPLLPRNREGGSVAAWLETRDRNRPLIFVTQGSVANRDLDQLLRPAMKGLAAENLDVLVTTGNEASAAALSPLANTRVESYAAYELVLRETAIFVTNGGYTGVQHALSCGVPVVVAGLTEDKPRVGHRVEWSGVGINLRTATPTKEQVQNAVREILNNPSYRERAQAVQKAILQVDTIGMIADHVDTAIRTVKENKLALTNKVS
ncbi:MAG TPA: glycosyltransferase [Acidobacteriaceae bacterium]